MPSPVPEKPGLLMRDPYQYTDAVLILPPLLARMLMLFDGEHDEGDLRAALTEATGERWSIAGVYNPLNRMARAGLVRTHVGPPTPERGGRSKRFFYLTPKGLATLNAQREVTDRMWAGLPELRFAPLNYAEAGQ